MLTAISPTVMARFMRAIHLPFSDERKMDGPDKPGHDDVG